MTSLMRRFRNQLEFGLGDTIIWGGNGDAQPPAGSIYQGTMMNVKWADGGFPQ